MFPSDHLESIALPFPKTSGGIYRADVFHDLFLGTAGREGNPVDYSLDSASVRFQEKALLTRQKGLEGRRIIMLDQLHGDLLHTVTDYPTEDLPWAAGADGLITTLPGICLVIRTADCVPVFLFDPRQRIIGAVHSGWRGCRLNIAGKMARTLISDYGCRPSDLVACLLPSIGPESYQVNEDVASHFPGHVSRENSHILLNLWSQIEDSLTEAGILRENVYNTRLCTLQNSNRFFSHRGGDAGRNLNIAYIPS